MALYKRGVTWHYDFAVAGKGYRGSTKEKSETRARAKESTLMAEVINLGESGIPRKAPRLADFAPRFLEWVEISRLKPNTKRYYRHGWKLIEATPRHTYGTFVYSVTKNLKLVMDSMGHTDIRTAMRYQHPELNLVREVIDQRNRERHNLRHSDANVQ